MNLKLTKHAKARRKERGLTEHQIEAVVADPDTTYTTVDGHRLFQRDGVVVVMGDDDVVITVAFR